jgi:pimeloyl-ACP methyl ester carboxylesterase
MTPWITCLLAGAMTLLLAAAASAEAMDEKQKSDYVVLLHGMGRTSLSMKRMEHYLANHGYRVINVTYHSRRLSIEQLSEDYLRNLLAQKITDPGAKVHFVTHSLGGIILRQYLANHAPENLGRVVMLAPPNHGSEIIDCLQAHPISREFIGASGRELGTGADAVPNRLGPVHFECGVIAGDRSFNPFLTALLPRPNDGKVSVASAKVEGMSDCLVLHSTHTWLMWRERALRQTLRFLESGHFDHANRNRYTAVRELNIL